MTNKETEIKLLFKNKKEVIGKLSPGIKFSKKVNVVDRYYGRDKDSIRNKNSFVRIREINGNIELTYKGRAGNRNDIIRRTEIIVKISSAELMKKILREFGYNKISIHQSEKEYWYLGDIEIVFVEFIKPAHLRFMEIEARSSAKIQKIVKKLSGCVSEIKESIFDRFDRANRKRGTT